MTEPEIDRAIDRTVRDLMDVDANPAFRVRFSIGCSDGARRVPALVTAAAAAAVLVLALVWMRSAPPGGSAPAPIARVEEPLPRVAPQGEVGAAVRQPVTPRADGRRAPVAAARNPSGSIPPGVITAADVPATWIAPLSAIEPITVTRASCNCDLGDVLARFHILEVDISCGYAPARN